MDIRYNLEVVPVEPACRSLPDNAEEGGNPIRALPIPGLSCEHPTPFHPYWGKAGKTTYSPKLRKKGVFPVKPTGKAPTILDGIYPFQHPPYKVGHAVLYERPRYELAKTGNGRTTI